MATRRTTKYPTWKQWKAHPFKSYKRAARKLDRGRAEWLKERREIKEDRAESRLLRDKELAPKRARRKASRDARKERVTARIAEAQRRRAAASQPPVRNVQASPVQRRATQAEVSASLCNSTDTDDHQPCQNKSTGGPCSAGHVRARSRRTRTTA